MEHKQQAEKSLKRFLKHKIAYTAGLLVSFLIAGNLAMATSTVTDTGATPGSYAATPFAEGGSGVVGSAILQEELLSKIAAQRAEIEGLIAENEAKLRELEMNELLLLRRGDFYSRPIYPSTQIFFNYGIEHAEKMKDMTASAFAADIETIAALMGGAAGDATARAKAMEALVAGNGTVIDDARFSETIDIGANVVPAAPVIPTIQKSIALSVTPPNVVLGALPNPTVTAISAPVITPPSGITAIIPPDAPLVSVTTPGAINDVNVTVTPISAPSAPSVTAKSVTVPAAPVVTPPTITAITPTTVSFSNGSYQGNYWWHGGTKPTPSTQTSSGTGSPVVISDVPDGTATTANAYVGFWGIREPVTISANITVANNPGRAIEIDEATHQNDYTSTGILTLAASNTIGIDLQGTHYNTNGNNGTWNWTLAGINQTMITNAGTIHGADDGTREKQEAMGFNNYDHSSNNTMTRLVNTGTITMDAKNSLGIQLKPEVRSSNGTDSHVIPGTTGMYGGAVLMQGINETSGTININNNNSYALSTAPFNTSNGEGIFGYHYDPAVFTAGAYAGYYQTISGLFNKGTLNIKGDASIGIGLFHPIQAVRNESSGTINVKSGTQAIGIYSEAKTMYLAQGATDSMGSTVTAAGGAGTPTVETAGTINVSTAAGDNATKSAGVRTGKADGKITVLSGGVVNVAGTENYGAVQASTAGSIVLNAGSQINVTGNKSIGYVLMTGTGTNSGTITATSTAALPGNIGFFGETGTFTNNAGGIIKAVGQDGIAVILKKGASALAFTNDGTINIASNLSAQPKIAVYNDGGTFTLGTGGNITLDANTEKAVGLYNVAGSATVSGKIAVGGTSATTSSIGVVASSGAPVTFSTASALLDLGTNAIGLYSTDNNPSSFTLNALKVNLANGAVFMYYDSGTPSVNNLANVTFSTLSNSASLIYADNAAQVTVGNAQNITTSAGSNDDFIPYVANGNSGAKIILAANLTTDTKVGMAGSTGGDITINSGATLKMTGAVRGSNDVGVYSDAGTIVNSGTIDLASQSVGMIGIFAKKATAALPDGTVTNAGTITLGGNATGNIGIFAQDNTKVTQTGTITINTDKSIGIYALNSDLDINLASPITLVFGSAADESIGVYLDGQKTLRVLNDITFSSNNEQKNILVYVKNKGKVENKTSGKSVTVDGVAPATSPGHTTIGFYLDGLAAAPNTYDGGTVGVLSVLREAVGIYSNVYNEMTLGTVNVTGAGTVGVFVNGEGKISGAVKPSSSAVGVYGKTGKLTIDAAKLYITLDSSGVGMYMKDGAWATGADIEITNAASASNVGIYYDPNNTTTIHDTNVILDGSNPVMGIYLADGKELKLAKEIKIDAKKSVGAMAGAGSTFTVDTAGAITINSADSVGLYTTSGKIVNDGTVSVGSITLLAGDKYPTGMAGISAAGQTATVENNGTINSGAATGVYLGGVGTTSGKNTGTIETTTGTAVYVNGGANTFTGAGGTLKTTGTHGIGLYLDNTVAGTVASTGTLNIGTDGIAVYAQDSPVDFALAPAGARIIGVVADGTSALSQNVTVGNGSVGIYVLDDNVSIGAITVATGNVITSGASTYNPVGIFLAEGLGTYALTGQTVDAQDGIGVYLEGGLTSPSVDLTLDALVKTTGGVAVFVGNNSILTTNGVEIELTGGEGVYIANGGTANIGTGANQDEIRFISGGGIGIFNDGGTLNLGANFLQTGNGTLVATKNGDLSYAGTTTQSGVTYLLGIYDNLMTANNTLLNTGSITMTGGGIGIAAIQGATAPGTFTVTLTNAGTITVSGQAAGQPTIALYTDVAEIVNSGSISVGTDAMGIYAAGGKDITNNDITITGTDATGIYLKNKLSTIISSQITSTAARNTGIAVSGVTADGTLDVDAITLGAESVGVLLDNSPGSSAGVTLDGTITLGNGSATKRSIGVIAKSGSKGVVAPTASVTTGTDGIGAYVDNTSSLTFDAGSFTLGANSIYVYSDGGNITLSGGTIQANNIIGMVLDGGTFANGGGSLTASNGGTGVYVMNTDVASIPDGFVTAQGGTSASAPFTVGIYFDHVAGTAVLPQVNQTGFKSVGIFLENTSASAANPVAVPTGNEESIGLAAQNGSAVTLNAGVSVDGDKNVGVYADNSPVTVNGAIQIGNSTPDPNLAKASVGVYMTGQSYTGTGNIQIGNSAIGVYGVNLTANSTQTGNITVGNDGLGVYMTGATGTESLTTAGTVAVGNKGLGIYGGNLDLNVNGNMNLGMNGALGIVSEGNGDINYSGDVTTGTGGSLGIYKSVNSGESAAVNAAGSSGWTIGDNGYGIYAEDKGGGTITVSNGAAMTLGQAALGIYASGNVTVANTAVIAAGPTDFGGDTTIGHQKDMLHLNSVAIYLDKGAQASNTGTLKAEYEHSLAVYAQGAGTEFVNNGAITVDNGATGMLIRDGAKGVNNGTITIGTNQPTGTHNVGMAAYKGATIENNGTITVGKGIGMIVGSGAFLANNADIYVTNGTGIQGAGTVLNKGNIYALTGDAKAEDLDPKTEAEVGAVRITADGKITINGSYVSVGGTLHTDGALVVDGAYADVSSGLPVFEASSISGSVNILPDFALTGNGKTYEIENFVNTAAIAVAGSKITPVLGPLFVGKITNAGTLLIAKRPYPDITVGDRFDRIYGQWDDLLDMAPTSVDAEALKGMNYYLAGLYDMETYTKEAARMLSETRGDIYATIQNRMADVERAYDDAFEELVTSRNFTRDTDKYSVIYRHGDYRDPTLGIDDYEYNVAGLYYMKEKDGRNFGNKYGWSLGFTVGDFKFDDGPTYHSHSRERIYSVRAGLHLVHGAAENDRFQWTSRLEAGYNYHRAERKLELETLRTNKGNYDSYQISLDNKAAWTFYRSLTTKIDGYAALNLEYGAIRNFSERHGTNGGLLLDIKGEDYFSVQPEIGLTAEKKVYIGKKLSMKLSGKLAYAYELGDWYDGNSARSSVTGGEWTPLVEPDKLRHILKGRVGVTLEKADRYGVTLEAEARKASHKDDMDMVYGLRFHYKFMNDR